MEYGSYCQRDEGDRCPTSGDMGERCVAKLDNPAGRLHTVLTAFQTACSRGLNIQETWQATLSTEGVGSTLIGVAEVASLVPAIEQALIRAGDHDQLSLFYEFAEDWASAVIFPRRDFQAQAASNYLPNKRVMHTLAGLSGFLSIAASEGPVPPQATMTELHDQVQGLIDSLADDTELPSELRREIADHLQRLASALLHFRIGGPDAVKSALDRLRVTVAFAPEPVKQTGMWKRVAATGGVVWVAFTSSPVIADAIEGWGRIGGMLPPGGP
jgi:hypothetical protein